MQKYSDLDLMGFDIDDMGIVEIRLALSLWLESEILRRSPHRFRLTPDVDVDVVLNQVNADLDALGFPPMSLSDMDQIRATAEVRRTPERLARYLAANPPPEDGGELIPVGAVDSPEAE